MAWCLRPEFVEKLKNVNIEKIARLPDSASRRKALAKFVGEENASQVNAVVESKLLLKNQKLAFARLSQKMLKKEEIPLKRDIFAKIKNMDARILSPESKEAFLQDVASKKFGYKVTYEDVKNITKFSNEMNLLEKKIQSENSPEALAYGRAYYNLLKYSNKLKSEGLKLSIKETLLNPIKSGLIWDTFGTFKSLKATYDNSFHGKQGIKLLYGGEHKTWLKGYLESWKAMKSGLKGKDPLEIPMADALSRENMRNGTYKAMDLAIGIKEEPFVVNWLGKIPVAGRLYKGAEGAYTAAGITQRVNLADKIVKAARENGQRLDPVLDRALLRDYGTVINSMTGIGDIGRLNIFAKEINAAVFSVKLAKSQLDTFAAIPKMLLKENRKNPALRLHAKKISRSVATVAALQMIAESLNPGMTESNPTSSNFGKLRIDEKKDLWFDPTGGIASMLTLAARVSTGQYKNKKGDVVNIRNRAGYQMVAKDFIYNFMVGKFAPLSSLLVSLLLTGKTYMGEEPTLSRIAKELTIPISTEQVLETREVAKKTGRDLDADDLMSFILDFHGFSVSPRGMYEEKKKIEKKEAKRREIERRRREWRKKR